jgi:hypothetical protein
MKNELKEKFVKAAKVKFDSDNVQVDHDERVVSPTPDGAGAWVRAWVWVSTDEVQPEVLNAEI